MFSLETLNPYKWNTKCVLFQPKMDSMPKHLYVIKLTSSYRLKIELHIQHARFEICSLWCIEIRYAKPVNSQFVRHFSIKRRSSMWCSLLQWDADSCAWRHMSTHSALCLTKFSIFPTNKVSTDEMKPRESRPWITHLSLLQTDETRNINPFFFNVLKNIN